MKRFWTGVISVLCLSLFSVAASFGGQKLTIAYTGDTAGYVLPCG
ncbi:hypothetical protein [uncultured Desulfobacter sp.]|nr:hypothetical protein [uncultured Desulfobacter sp.]